MAYKIEIERIDNGFIVTKHDVTPDNVVNVFEEKDSEFGELFAMKKALWEVLEYFGIGYNKHGEKNIVVRVIKNKELP